MANVTYTVPNKSGSYDGDMVVKQYSSMTINNGDTVTTDQPCKGLMILVQGNCTINGTLSMKARGPSTNPTASGGSDNNTVDANGLRMPFATSGGSSSLSASNTLFNGCGNDARSVIANFKTIASSGNIITLVRQGANGGSAPGSQQNVGGVGSNGSTGQTGGGGAGGRGWTATSGNGSYGSCFAGGSGGGGSNGNTENSGVNATAWAGAGGRGATDHSAATSGGAGNPAGANDTTSGSATASENGVGGLIILIVGGNLTIGASGSITTVGSVTGNCTGGNQWHATGGGSGGGNIVIVHRGSYTNNGTVTANGGQSGTVNANQYARRGGAGGNGSIQTLQVL